jgi:hypothetical protein
VKLDGTEDVRSSFFRDVMQHLLIVIDRRFGTTFLSNLIKGSSCPRKCRGTLKQTYDIAACPACSVLF